MIEQRERPSISPTYHYQASMLWTGKKSRLLRLLQKTKIMERLGGLVFLFGIPLCILGCVFMILSYTNSATEESDELNIFSILGPALMVLAFLSLALGCLLDGKYKESRLPTIGRLYSTNHFRNDAGITKDVSHFEKHNGSSRPQCNILPHPKQDNSSVKQQDAENSLKCISVKGEYSDNLAPPDVVVGTRSSNLKGILKKPSNWRKTLVSDQTMKTVDFALTTTQSDDDCQQKTEVASPAEKSVTIVGPGRILSAAGLLLWALSEKIKLFDPSSRLQTVSCRSKFTDLPQVPKNIWYLYKYVCVYI